MRSGAGLLGSAGRADGLHIVTDVDRPWRITWVIGESVEWSPGRLPGLRSCGRFPVVADPQVIDVLTGPWPVVVVEHPADGINHELGVARV